MQVVKVDGVLLTDFALYSACLLHIFSGKADLLNQIFFNIKVD